MILQGNLKALKDFKTGILERSFLAPAMKTILTFMENQKKKKKELNMIIQDSAQEQKQNNNDRNICMNRINSSDKTAKWNSNGNATSLHSQNVS